MSKLLPRLQDCLGGNSTFQKILLNLKQYSQCIYNRRVNLLDLPHTDHMHVQWSIPQPLVRNLTSQFLLILSELWSFNRIVSMLRQTDISICFTYKTYYVLTCISLSKTPFWGRDQIKKIKLLHIHT